MNDRDTLAEFAWVELAGPGSVGDAASEIRYSADQVADIAIAAGWRPPVQVITDPDTPDTYPARTIGIDRDGEVWVSRFSDWVTPFDRASTGERLGDVVADFGPLTIVYIPGPTPSAEPCGCEPSVCNDPWAEGCRPAPHVPNEEATSE